MVFEKLALSVDEQINQLEHRGMVFNDRAKAAHYLSNISYYRLSAYWFTFLQEPISEHKFRSNTTFESAIQTYVFDRKLRILIFDEIERIEVALRTQIIHLFSCEYGSNWYENANHFRSPVSHTSFNDLLRKEFDKSKETFVLHYKEKYTAPLLPPCWMAFELVTFGQLSLLYKNLRSSTAHTAVANHFCVHKTVLVSWLEALSYIRNLCAHHSRLWNRKLPITPVLPNYPAQEWLSVVPAADYRNRIFIPLATLQYLLKCIVPTTRFKQRLKALLDEFTEIPRAYMGFPDNWESDPFWQ